MFRGQASKPDTREAWAQNCDDLPVARGSSRQLQWLNRSGMEEWVSG